MATIYIDPTFGTGGDGTLANPYNSWASVTWTNGNTYLQKENTIFIGSIIVGASTVTLGTYLAANGAQTENKNLQACINANGAQLGVHNNFVKRDDVTINNLRITNCRHASAPIAVYANNSGGLRWIVKNCTIDDVITTSTPTGSSAGIKLFSDNAKILNNVIYNISDDGILVEGDNIEIAYNRIYNISVGGTFGDNIQVACGVISANDCWVHHNYCDHTNVDSKQCIILSTGAGGIARGIVENNICFGFKGVTHKTMYSDSPDSIFRKNIIYDGWWGAQMANGATGAVFESNVVVMSQVNVVSSESVRGLMLSANNQKAYNNTIICLDKTKLAFGIEQQNYTGVVISNNISVGWMYGIRVHSSNPATESYNCVYNNETNVVNESLVSQSLGTGTVAVDPQLTSIYTLKTTSPLIEQGLFTTNKKDANNVLRNNPPTIGAYEFVEERAVR